MAFAKKPANFAKFKLKMTTSTSCKGCNFLTKADIDERFFLHDVAGYSSYVLQKTARRKTFSEKSLSLWQMEQQNAKEGGGQL